MDWSKLSPEELSTGVLDTTKDYDGVFTHDGFEYMIGAISGALFVRIGAEWRYTNKKKTAEILKDLSSELL